MTASEFIKIMKKRGWKVARQNGSHVIMKKAGHTFPPIPDHGSKDIKTGLLRALCKKAGIDYPPKRK